MRQEPFGLCHRLVRAHRLSPTHIRLGRQVPLDLPVPTYLYVTYEKGSCHQEQSQPEISHRNGHPKTRCGPSFQHAPGSADPQVPRTIWLLSVRTPECHADPPPLILGDCASPCPKHLVDPKCKHDLCHVNDVGVTCRALRRGGSPFRPKFYCIDSQYDILAQSYFKVALE